MLTSKSSVSRSELAKTVWTIFMLVVVAYQSWILFPQVAQDIILIRKDIGQSGLWRSANFSQNQRFANYIQFILEVVPPDARVILPAENEGPWALTNTPFMQFFLAPREVINCLKPVEECITDFSNSNTYLLILDPDSIAGRLDLDIEDRSIQFDSTWSVLQPQNPASNLQSSPQGFSSLGELLVALLIPCLWLFILIASGYLITTLLLPGQNSIVKFAIGFGISLGILSLSLYLTMLLGIPLTPEIILAITLTLLVLAVTLILYHHRWQLTQLLRFSRPTKFRMDFWLALFTIIFFAALILSVGMAYHSTDAIVLWGAKGYGIASRGLIPGSSEWGTSTARYPLQIPILIASAKLLFNENLPASKIIFPLFYLGTILMVYSYLSKRIPRSIAGSSSLVLTTAGIVFRHSHIGYANMSLSFFIICGILLFSDAIERDNLPAGEFFFTGVLLMFAGWTRPEGLPLSFLLAILLIFISSVNVKESRMRSYLYLFVPLILYGVIWFVTSPTIYQTSTKESLLIPNAIDAFSEGNFHLSEIGFILKYMLGELIDPTQWGFLLIGILILFIPSIFSPKKFLHSSPVFAGLLYIIVIAGLYYFTSFDSIQDISWWVSTGLNRMILPGVILLWIGIIEINFSNQNQTEGKPILT